MSVTLVRSAPKFGTAPKSKQPVVLFYPEFVQLTGSVDAALLLSQLAYWFRPGPRGKPRVRVRRNGRLTYVRSNEAMREDTGLSEWRLRKARERLESLGLTQVEVHLFGNKTLPHWWLDVSKLEPEAPLKTGPETPSKPVLRAISRSCIEPCREEVREGRNAREAAREQVGETAVEEACLKFDIDVVEPEDEPAEAAMGVKYADGGMAARPTVTAAQVAAKLAASRSRPAGGKISAGALAGMWKKHEYDRTGQFQKNWTGKELGQAGKLVRALGADAWPVVRWALGSWSRLVFEVKSMKGVGSAPGEPHLGWLLQYHDVAVRLWETSETDDEDARRRKPVADAGTVKFPAVVQLVAVEEPGPATAAEAASVLSALTKKPGVP